MSGQTKHTPGVWDIHEDANHIEIHPLSDINGTHIIADVVNIRISRQECAANAWLIATAPELLQQLEALVSQIESSKHLVVPPNVKAIIRKAKGESQ